MQAYSRVFDFVEVNSTFYGYPSSEMVRSWRTRVPMGFEFGVRCHRDLTHKYLLEPRDESYQVLKRMLSICSLLKAETLILQTPATLEFTNSRMDAIRTFLQSADTGHVQLVWEIRRPSTLDYPPSLSGLMKDVGIVHCVDISRHEKSITKSDLLNTRLFGLGNQNVYQYTDEELTNIQSRDRLKLSKGSPFLSWNSHVQRRVETEVFRTDRAVSYGHSIDWSAISWRGACRGCNVTSNKTRTCHATRMESGGHHRNK